MGWEWDTPEHRTCFRVESKCLDGRVLRTQDERKLQSFKIPQKVPFMKKNALRTKVLEDQSSLHRKLSQE